MDAQLVAAAGLWPHPDAGFAGGAANHLPIGLCGPSVFLADHLARTVRPIGGQGQVDVAAFACDFPRDPCDVGFLRPALFKLLPQKPLGLLGLGKDHHARSVAIQPMHQKGVPLGGLKARDQTIRPAFQLARHRQQPCRFVRHKDQIILKEDVQGHIGRVVVEVRDHAIWWPAAFSALARWAIWAGPTSQQPPTMVAPISTQRRAKAVYFSGVRSWRAQ